MLLLALFAAGPAQAAEAGVMKYRYGDHLVGLYGVGDYLLGSDATMLQGAHPYRRYSGALGFGVGFDNVLTSFGALVGFEAEAELGLSSGNLHSDGVARFNTASDNSSDPPTVGLAGRLAGRVKVSPLWVRVSEDLGLRLGLMAGLSFDWFGVEAYNQVGSYDVGAQAALQASSFSMTVSAWFTPPQGVTWELTRLKGSVIFVFGPLILGVRTSLTNARLPEANKTQQAGLVAELSFSAVIGVAFGEGL